MEKISKQEIDALEAQLTSAIENAMGHAKSANEQLISAAMLTMGYLMANPRSGDLMIARTLALALKSCDVQSHWIQHVIDKTEVKNGKQPN